jgi:hypothetical protein
MAKHDDVDYQLVGEADAVNLIEKQSVRRVDLDCFTLHQLRDGRLLVDFLSGNCAVLTGRGLPVSDRCRPADPSRIGTGQRRPVVLAAATGA